MILRFPVCYNDTLLVMYTFEVYRVDLRVEKFAKRNVQLIPDKMELLTDTELTQYFMESWSLEYNDPSTVKS